MRYLKHVEKINEALTKHKLEIDRLISIYNAEIQSHNEELKKMQGIYTKEYIEQYKKNWKPTTNYAEAIRKSSERAVIDTELLLGKIKKEIDRYFDTPVRQEFSNKINAISVTGMALKDREFELLTESASNYMEMRLVQHLAENRTKTAIIPSINEHGYTENKETIVKNPYKVDLPDIDFTYREFNDFSCSVKSMAKHYCGENAELKDFIEEASSYAPLIASGYFRNNAQDKFSKTMDKANSCIKDNSVKTSLTEADTRLIDALIDSRYPSLAESRVKAIAEADSNIGDLLRLDDRYKYYLDEE